MMLPPPGPWPVGFGFRPTDVELVNDYLKPKINGGDNSKAIVIPEVDVCKYEPWDLPDQSVIKSEDQQCYFFSPIDPSYHTGKRASRSTNAGYWKTTGNDRKIESGDGRLIGRKKTLVFHRGRAPKGVRTDWIIHEYRTSESEFNSGEQGSFVLCCLKLEKKRKKHASSNVKNKDSGTGRTFSSGIPGQDTISCIGTGHSTSIPTFQSRCFGTSPILSIETGRNADASRSMNKPRQPHPKKFKILVEKRKKRASSNVEKWKKRAGSNVDEVERNVGMTDSSGLSPTPIMPSPGETQHGTDTLEEFGHLNQGELPEPDMQENLQTSLNAFDIQSTGNESWLARGGDGATTYALRPEESHFNGNGASVISNHVTNVSAEVGSQLLDPVYAQPDLDGCPHISSQMTLAEEFSMSDMVNLVPNDLPFENDPPLEFCSLELSVSGTVDEVLDNEDEDSLEVADTQKDSAPKVGSDNHIFVIEEVSPSDSASGRESGSGSDVDTVAVIVQDGLEFDASAHSSESALLPSGSSDMDNDDAYHATTHLVNLPLRSQSLRLNVSSMGSAANFWDQESTRKPELIKDALSNNLSNNTESQTGSELSSEKVDDETDSELCSKKDDNEVKSVITEQAGECAERQIAEDTEVSGSIFLHDVDGSSDHDDTTFTEARTAFSEISHESNSVLRPRTRGTHENGDKLEGLSLHSEIPGTGSVSITWMIVVQLAVRLICVVIRWYLSS